MVKIVFTNSIWNFFSSQHFIFQLMHTTLKKEKLLKHFKINCSNMFRFTRKPSSGSHGQFLAKITHLVKSGYVELVQEVISVMTAYCDLWGVCTHASQVTICSHNTDKVLYELYLSNLNKCAILAKYWPWLPDDGFLVNRNMLEQFPLF